MEIFWKPHSRIGSESALLRTASSALNLEVLGRGLAAIGNLFIFNRLSFVERGKASFLDRRNRFVVSKQIYRLSYQARPIPRIVRAPDMTVCGDRQFAFVF